jgi:hypothetical protein
MNDMNEQVKEQSLNDYMVAALVDSMNRLCNQALEPMGFLTDKARMDEDGCTGGSLCDKKYEIARSVAQRYEKALLAAATRECQQGTGE